MESVQADNFSNRPSKISKMETDEHETKEDDRMEVEEEKQRKTVWCHASQGVWM